MRLANNLLPRAINVGKGSGLCENSSARRARRNISKKLRIMESNRAPRTMFDTLLENCIFYISQLYEFSHRLAPLRTWPSLPPRLGGLNRPATFYFV